MNEGKGIDILMDFLNSDILNFNDKTHDVKKGQYLLVTQNIPKCYKDSLLKKNCSDPCLH